MEQILLAENLGCSIF